MSLRELLPEPATDIVVVLLGLVIGSFLNVCIHRIPRGISVVFPASHCPQCGGPIRARDNVPVAAWIWLGGKCRDCRAPISFRYPAVEAANALLWLLAARRASSVAGFVAGALFFSAILVLMLIDFDHQILPDVITLPLAAAGLVFSFFGAGVSWPASLAGILAGGGGLWLVGWGYEKITRREGMGLGDAKMLAAIGAFTGPGGVVVTILFASLAGSLVGLLLLFRGGSMKTRLPFGVFLGLAGIAAFLWAPALVAWYAARLPE